MGIFINWKKYIDDKLEDFEGGSGVDIPKVDSTEDLSEDAEIGDLAVVLDIGEIYVYTEDGWNSTGLEGEVEGLTKEEAKDLFSKKGHSHEDIEKRITDLEEKEYGLTEDEGDKRYSKKNHSHNEFDEITSIQEQLDGITTGMIFKEEVETYEDIPTDKSKGDTFVVTQDENNDDKRSLYTFNGENLIYLGTFEMSAGVKIDDENESGSTTYSSKKIESSLDNKSDVDHIHIDYERSINTLNDEMIHSFDNHSETKNRMDNLESKVDDIEENGSGSDGEIDIGEIIDDEKSSDSKTYSSNKIEELVGENDSGGDGDYVEKEKYDELLDRFKSLEKKVYGDEVPISEPKDYEYDENDDGELTITNYTGDDEHIRIPSEIDGKPVKIIGYDSFVEKGIVSVSIPRSVTDFEKLADVITSNAFRSNKINSITNYSNVEIPDSALRGQEIEGSLYKYNIQCEDNSVILINYRVNDKTEIEIIDEIGEFTVKAIGPELFKDKGLSSVIIPGSVESIQEYSFENNNFKEIFIPKSVLEIKEGAFEDNPLEIIKGEKDSYAEEWASENGFDFEAID